MRSASVAAVVSAAKGTWPVRHSTSTRASEYTSERPSRRRPRACSGRRVASGADGGARGLGPGRLGERTGQTEVSEAQTSLVVEEQVAGLHVAVHQATQVGVCQRPGGIEADQQRLGGRQRRRAVEHLAQAAAPEELGHQVRDHADVGVVLTPVEDRHDVRVVQGTGGAGLGAEATEERLVLGECLVQQLDRHAAPELRVDGEEDARRGPHSDGGDQSISSAEHTPGLLRESGGHRRHGTAAYRTVRGRARPTGG